MECLAQHHSLILQKKKTRAVKKSNYVPISGSKFPCQVVFSCLVLKVFLLLIFLAKKLVLFFHPTASGSKWYVNVQ